MNPFINADQLTLPNLLKNPELNPAIDDNKALRSAVMLDDIPKIRLLLDDERVIEALDRKNGITLITKVLNRDWKVLNIITRNPKVADKLLPQTFDLAVIQDKGEVIDRLLLCPPVIPTYRSLLTAIKNGSERAILKLLRVASVIEDLTIEENIVLNTAIEWNDVTTTDQLLFRYKSVRDALTLKNLFTAIQVGSLTLVNLLLGFPQIINVLDYTSLVEAIENGEMVIANRLLDFHKVVSTLDGGENKALLAAYECEEFIFVDKLLTYSIVNRDPVFISHFVSKRLQKQYGFSVQPWNSGLVGKSETHKNCPICSLEYKPLELTTQLKCEHVYHFSCFLQWRDVNRSGIACCYRCGDVGEADL